MTITAHRPPTANAIDPNDDAASKELSFSVTPITATDLVCGTVRLRLPPQRTDGPANTFGPPTYDHLHFADELVCATVGRVADVVEAGDGSGEVRVARPPSSSTSSVWHPSRTASRWSRAQDTRQGYPTGHTQRPMAGT